MNPVYIFLPHIKILITSQVYSKPLAEIFKSTVKDTVKEHNCLVKQDGSGDVNYFTSLVHQYALNITILYSMMMGLQGIKLLHVFYFKGGSNLVEEMRKKIHL